MKYKELYSKQQFNTTNLIANRSYYDLESVIRNRMQSAPQFMKRLELDTLLSGHQGCVNCLEWSSNGRHLASASDDYHIMIWDPYRRRRLTNLQTPHHGNIFSVKFMPNSGNSILLSGAADSKVFGYNIERQEAPIWSCHCHIMRVKRLATAPENPNLFWSSGEDGVVLQFDMREPHNCRSNDRVMLINLAYHLGSYSAEVKCIAINPRRPELLAVGSGDSYARIYDRRMISLNSIKYRSPETVERPAVIGIFSLQDFASQMDSVPENCSTYYCPGQLRRQSGKQTAITYLTFSPDGTELLVNMGAEQIYLYDINKSVEPTYLNLPTFKTVAHSSESTSTTTTTTTQDPSEIIESFDSVNSLSTSSPKKQQKLIINTKKTIPIDVENLKKKGNVLLENEKYLQAIYQYTLAIQISPEYPILYLNRATAYMRRKWLGDNYAALRDCQRALELDPNYLKAHFRMARALLEIGCASEANEALDALRERFESCNTHHGVLMLQKDINSAMETSNKDEDSSSCFVLKLSRKEVYWRSKAKDYNERFVGHCNTTTDIKEANYFGSDGKYIIAGSDDGNFFIWERPTNMITGIYKGDSSIVNCVQPHPHICLLATSGIDSDIRLWSPQPEENYESTNKIAFFEGAVLNNQQLMQADPYDTNMCRTS